MAHDRKSQRDKTSVRPRTGHPTTDTSPPSERSSFDHWVDRRLKTMHDAVLDEKIPDDMLRILLGDTSPGTDRPNAPDQPKARDER